MVHVNARKKHVNAQKRDREKGHPLKIKMKKDAKELTKEIN